MIKKEVVRITWEKCFLFYVLRGETFPKSSVFGCRCFLFFSLYAQLGKSVSFRKKKKQYKLKQKSQQGMIKYIDKDVKR